MLGHGVAADARVPSPFAEELEEEAEEAAKSRHGWTPARFVGETNTLSGR